MEPPRGFLATLWSFIRFLPFFIGLLFLGVIKGIVFCPLICLIMAIGNSAIILGLWPMHVLWTYYCILRAKRLGPVLKTVLFITVLPTGLILWPLVGIIGSIIGGAAYGFFSPIFATFNAVGEGKADQLFHCFYDGTKSTVEGCFTVVRDFGDVSFHSYLSVISDLKEQGPPGTKYYEIRLLYLPGALIAGVLGFLVDMPVISIIALCKFPFMLFKGWHRLFHDLIGREGPFLETICVPFAGLAILLWPLAVAGAVLGSIVSSLFLGPYAGVVAYQESSFWLALCYIVASIAIYDEYSNDVLGMPESRFPRPSYRRKDDHSLANSHTSSFSRPSSFKNPPSRTNSVRNPLLEVQPLELINSVFRECKEHGEILVSKGLITSKDFEDGKSSKGSGNVVSIGLPAFGILQILLRSARANSAGLLLSDNVTEITSSNRPKDIIFDWFFHPILIIKDQIKAENLSEEEEDYLSKLVLFSGDPTRLKDSNIGPGPELERRRAELQAFARRLQGITKSISRYPTFRRRIDSLINDMCEELTKKALENGAAGVPGKIPRSKSAFGRLFSQKSLQSRTSNHGSDQESQSLGRDVEIE